MKTTLAKFAIAAFSLALTTTASSQGQAPAQAHRETAKQVVSLLQAEKFDALWPLYSEAMRQAGKDTIPNAWKDITRQVGKMGDCATPRQESLEKIDLFISACQFEKVLLDVRVTIDAEGKVAGINVRPAEKK